MKVSSATLIISALATVVAVAAVLVTVMGFSISSNTRLTKTVTTFQTSIVEVKANQENTIERVIKNESKIEENEHIFTDHLVVYNELGIKVAQLMVKIQ